MSSAPSAAAEAAPLKHAHGPGSPVPVQTRSERFASGAHGDFAPVTGRELEWRLTPVEKIRDLIDGPLVNHGGDPLSRFLVRNDAPAFGQPTRSMVLRRIRGDGMPRMPPLATYQRDLAAEALLTAWINDVTYAEWQVIHFGSTSHPDAAPDEDPDGDGQNNRIEFVMRTHPSQPQPSTWPRITLAGANLELRFFHPAGRAGLVETSTDLRHWSVWNVNDNVRIIPTEDQIRTFTAPRNETRRYFRLKLEEP